jgi:UDP-N-acetyl-2-amino-2-deoxyglucuronate dehydrogenase
MHASKNVALLGAAGYVAPKHMNAIQATGQNLVAALDPSDSVGVLDSFSYDVAFFTEFERFDRHAERLRRMGNDSQLHYVSICTPNYLHDAHIRFALRIGAHAICEKPLVLNPWNLDALADMEKETGRKIYNVLQLRVHPSIVELKNKYQKDTAVKGTKRCIDLSYITSRGNWYFHSWKGDLNKSGGVVTNIGIHFFDMLMWLFGAVRLQEVHYSDEKKMAGFLELDHARIRWFLSVDNNDLPQAVIDDGKTTYRSITIDGEEIEFSGGFTDLHTAVYDDILQGRGFGLEDARPSINLVYELRNSIPSMPGSDRVHPFIRKNEKKSFFLQAV